MIPPLLLLLLCSLCAVFGPSPARAESSDSGELPNIVFIVVDALRADHLSAYGYHLKTSPHIDKLAAEGTRFEQAYCVIPLTGPSVTSMFTSRFPQEHGARINGVAVAPDSKWMFLPQILKRFGYANAAFVSGWPLTSRLTQFNRWFEVYDETLSRSYQLFSSSRFAEDVTPPAVAWLRQNKKSPFFLFIHYFDPHRPYHLREQFASPPPSGHLQTAPEWRDREMRERIRKYNSEIGYADHHIGKLLGTLDELGLRDSTLVVFTADHGESLGQHGYVGHGRHLYEDIVRVPLIVRYPGFAPAGKVIQERVSAIDLTPTLLDLTIRRQSQEKVPTTFAGLSLAAAIQNGEAIPERPIRYVTFAGKKGYAPKWLSWMWVGDDRWPLRLGKLEGTEKWVWSPRNKRLRIYDVAEDPLELAPQVLKPKESVYKRGTQTLKRWFDSTDLEEGETKMTERDAEILRSLGYVH